MNTIKNVFAGWKVLFSKLFSMLNPGLLLCLLIASAAAVLFVSYLYTRMSYNLRRYRFTIDKNRKGGLKKLTEQMMKYEAVKRMLTSLSSKVSMYTDYSFEKNLEIAAIVFILFVVAALVCLLIILPGTAVVWYVFLAYAGIAALFILLIFHVFNMTARIRFTSKLPETYKLLNSRYISQGNIIKAINASIDLNDFDRAVKRVMRIIRDALMKNNMSEINNTFKMIENNYKNEYLTLLLNLIKQAHYKGGEQVIKQQFEQATEEVLMDIENRKDLAATSRMYIALALFLPLGIAGIERFNRSALKEKAVEFYQSPVGLELKLAILGSIVLFIGHMLFLERSS